MATRLEANQIDSLIQLLAHRGYDVMGPTVRDGAAVYDRINSAGDLPRGWTGEQEPGRYRLKRRQDEALFGYGIGPQSWKKYLYPPQVKLFEAERNEGLFQIKTTSAGDTAPRFAFLGMRACDAAAIAVQDRVLLGGRYRDAVYEARRERLFVVAVQCTESAPTCFCASMGTGPRVPGIADLTLTEMIRGEEHWFLAEAGSEKGSELLEALESRPATRDECLSADAAVKAGAGRQSRTIDTQQIQELLHRNYEHARWEQVAERCLACANCTMVCPTCFCAAMEDASDVTGAHAERWRRWDSCFTLTFSYIHGGSVRTSSKARYRQWLTHKLASWIDQFGCSGCVGCGRCMTWCPVGIDITEEVRAIRGAVMHGKAHA